MNKEKKKNLFKTWNKSISTSIKGDNPDIAANRIFDGFYEPKNINIDRKFSKNDGIFTMGSCFARELESAFSAESFNILSMNKEALERADFKDKTKDNAVTTGFFHRYNLGAMLQEFQRAFSEIDFKEESTLLVETQPNEYVDLNYSDRLERLDLEGTLKRRAVGKELVQKVSHSKVIILTLGLTEGWFYKPAQLYANTVPADLLVRNKDDFEFRQIGFNENLSMLESLYNIICKHHIDGEFHLFLTVSPVPLRHTFTQEDIVVANMYAKSTLRTVAEEFSKEKKNITYFPSYEVAMYSNRDLVWRPDRIHINKECVRFIVQTFRNNYMDA